MSLRMMESAVAYSLCVDRAYLLPQLIIVTCVMIPYTGPHTSSAAVILRRMSSYHDTLTNGNVHANPTLLTVVMAR
jgi:hypothetical protein